jgi:hypothetical protein
MPHQLVKMLQVREVDHEKSAINGRQAALHRYVSATTWSTMRSRYRRPSLQSEAAGIDTRAWLRLWMRGAKVCVDALRCDASKFGACVRDKESESTVDGERRQYEY